MKLKCNRCGTAISTEVPDGTIVRAWCECPECIKKQPIPIEDLWGFCLKNGAERHGGLMGAPNYPFFTLKLLKKIAELHEQAKQRGERG